VLREREFVRLNENVYKIGMTIMYDPIKRIKQYPNNSELLFIMKTGYLEGDINQILAVVCSHMLNTTLSETVIPSQKTNIDDIEKC